MALILTLAVYKYLAININYIKKTLKFLPSRSSSCVKCANIVQILSAISNFLVMFWKISFHFGCLDIALKEGLIW